MLANCKSDSGVNHIKAQVMGIGRALGHAADAAKSLARAMPWYCAASFYMRLIICSELIFSNFFPPTEVCVVVGCNFHDSRPE